MQITEIARVLGVSQKALYRRRDHLLRELRAALMRAGITAADALQLDYGSGTADFGFRKSRRSSRPEPKRPEDDSPSHRREPTTLLPFVRRRFHLAQMLRR